MLGWGSISQRVVRTNLVVLSDPVPGHFPDFIQGEEQPGVQDLFAVGPVQKHDQSILVGLSGLDELQRHASISSPVRKVGSQELRAVVDSKGAGQTPFRLQLPEDAD